MLWLLLFFLCITSLNFQELIYDKDAISFAFASTSLISHFKLTSFLLFLILILISLHPGYPAEPFSGIRNFFYVFHSNCWISSKLRNSLVIYSPLFSTSFIWFIIYMGITRDYRNRISYDTLCREKMDFAAPRRICNFETFSVIVIHFNQKSHLVIGLKIVRIFHIRFELIFFMIAFCLIRFCNAKFEFRIRIITTEL